MLSVIYVVMTVNPQSPEKTDLKEEKENSGTRGNALGLNAQNPKLRSLFLCNNNKQQIEISDVLYTLKHSKPIVILTALNLYCNI